MSGFLVSAACKGRRPKRFAGWSVASRPRLTARLLRDRGVARFIVAPNGFGKTHVALDYAEVVFSFRHTFWINGESPCFLRDLDAGKLVEGVKCADAEPSLVVFDDVPDLDAERAAAFSAAIDELLALGNEVIVACVPASDAYGSLHRDRLKLAAADLLLADDELHLAPASAQGDSLEGRIACMAWGNDDGSALLSRFSADEPSASTVLAAFLALAFRACTFDDIRAYLPEALLREAACRAQEDYPFVGADCRERTFRAMRIDAAVLARSFSRRAEDLARRAGCEGQNDLARRVADDLLRRGEAGRACAIVGGLATKAACATWLADRGAELLEAGCLKAAHELFVSVDKRSAPRRVRLVADEAVRLLALDDARTAAHLADRLASSRAVAPEVRARMLCVSAAARADASRPLRREAMRELSQMARGNAIAAAGSAAASPSAALRLARAIDAGLAALVAESLRLPASVAGLAGREAAAAGAFLALSDLARACVQAAPADSEGALPEVAPSPGDVERLASWSLRYLNDSAPNDDDAGAREILGEPVRAGRLPWTRLRLAAALSHAVEAGVLSERFLPDERTRAEAHRGEVALFAERAAYRRDAIREQRAAIAADSSAGGRFSSQAPARLEAQKARVPTLYVGLFGGLDVRIGGVAVNTAALNRQKTKTLLALLVLNRGRELSRPRLLAMLWPALGPDAAQKSFYTVWSQLRRALSWDGSCPYLLRDQGGVRLDANLLESDVADFDEMCRALSFGPVDAEGWQAYLASIGGTFSQDLLPSETENECVNAYRRRFKSDLTDALVAGATRLLEAGEPRLALWFAREALRRDGGREDAYAVLMQAQVDSGQRAAAIDTYFSCRRYLADELGIDPSIALVELYRNVIGSVEELV